MNRRKRVLGALSAVVLLIGLWLALRPGGSPILGIGTITTMGFSNVVLTCFVTNNTSHAILLERPEVLHFQTPSQAVKSGESWGGLSITTNLMPNSVTTVSVNLSGKELSVLLLLPSTRPAGGLARAISAPIGKRFKKSFPNKFITLLWRTGLMDGQCHRWDRAFWKPNETLQATAAPPLAMASSQKKGLEKCLP